MIREDRPTRNAATSAIQSSRVRALQPIVRVGSDPVHRFRALAWLMAAGLGAFAVTLMLPGDDPQPPPAADAVEVPAASPPQAPEPLAASAPQLGSPSQAEAALRRVRERLRRIASQPRTTVAQLARSPGWIEFLATWLRLPQAEDDAQRLARIQAAFEQASGPVVRQNLIFLAALALPLEVALPWLQKLTRSADPDDAEDALVALAFTGEAAARAAFERLSRTPSPAKVRRIVDWYEQHNRESRSNDDTTRGLLRSYRAVEAYRREPYFKMVAYSAARGEQENRDWRLWVGWTERAELSRHESIDLVEAWLARYPGHPGSDDMALGIAWWYAKDGELLDAARWYSRTAVLPDQDVAWSAIRTLAGLCEIDLTPEDVLLLSEDEGISTPNRRFFQYVWLRRLAAERGFDVALRELRDFARREPDSEMAAAWHARFAVDPPKGLDSGLVPLPADDPLRRRVASRVPWPERGRKLWVSPAPPAWTRFGFHTGGSEQYRLHPWPEPVRLDRGRLPNQVRAWETLAELERRAAKARGDARADLLYKQAAVLYHDRDAVYPVYGRHTYDFSHTLTSVHTRYGFDGEQPAVVRKARQRFETTSLSYVRAMALFEQIEREHPHWAGLDKVIFSEGLLWRRLIDYRPSSHHVYWWRWAETGEMNSIRKTVATFERLIARFPDSPLADDAAAAVAWWRRARPNAFAK